LKDGIDDPEGLGLHVNDRFNIPELDGRIIVNKGHTASDPDVLLAPQFQGVIKPHQVISFFCWIKTLFSLVLSHFYELRCIVND